MAKTSLHTLTRRRMLSVFAAGAVCAAPTYSNAFSLFRGSGDIRRLRMYSAKTGESLDMIYWVDGEYIADALKEVNWFMRDLRAGESCNVDTRAIDIMAATQQLMETDESYTLLSGYRTARTNSILRSRSRGVARNSLHMKGQAADLRMKTRSVSQLASAAKHCSSGGVGQYNGSNFVHVDCGPIRTWRG